MVFTRKYNLVNNLTGWGMFVIALITYWLTLEPTASYWDCGEFIIQADKLEIGHPPGNPIFMLTARFFANFAFGDASKVALMVNAMSGLLSALTILLLFWTVTHLVRRLVVKCADACTELSLTQYLLIMGSGVCASLAYAWSDTFWFSAVEGEVYAFSSFCTALVFWLILKWENHADEPHSDRYLILIAYVIGVSIAVHLLNLLCIPAIVLVYCYRRVSDMNVKKSLLALLIGFAIIVFVLYGLVPGFIEVAGYFELFAVNKMHLPFNTGLMIYTLLTVVCFIWSLYELYVRKSLTRIRISFMLAVLISGILFIGSGVLLGFLLFAVLGVVLFWTFRNKLPVRWLNIVMWSISVIFVGYSSYALILIRANAKTPMNQSTPDNVFDLSSYLNREQYGEVPLLYGRTFESSVQLRTTEGESQYVPGATQQTPVSTVTTKGNPQYAKGVHGAHMYAGDEYMTNADVERVNDLADRSGDFYAMYGYSVDPVYNPELNILLPRIHSPIPSHKSAYEAWVPGLTAESEPVLIQSIDVESNTLVPQLEQDPVLNEETGEYYFPAHYAHKPTFAQNMKFFFSYQLNHMYWRYFMWNFAGRQNDICNQWGELDAGNWISGIPFIDNPRLGDQSLLPDTYGKDNPGHNVFYMLPLLLGVLGLLWQAFRGKRGIEQFWVVFFLFFMTGIAIVLYLNQPPLQPRERDYAFAGSFYAFAIWIGMGVPALYYIVRHLLDKKDKAGEEARVLPDGDNKKSVIIAAVAAFIGVLVPLQMVSQTWDDHDRSNRYAARDYAINYLNSLEPDAIVFCNGDNDTFPLWYAQEVEGVRPDVKIINLSYLSSAWYADQQRIPSYTAPGVKFTVTPEQYAYHKLDYVGYGETDTQNEVPLLDALKEIYTYTDKDKERGQASLKHINTFIEVDSTTVRKRGLVPDGTAPLAAIPVQLKGMAINDLLMLDIIATNAANGWERPIYWACTVGEEYYKDFLPYVRRVGMAFQLVPYEANQSTDPDVAAPVINKYLWGGSDNYADPPYFDETAGRMIYATRMSVIDLASAMVSRGTMLQEAGKDDKAALTFKNAKEVLQTYDKRLADYVRPAESNIVRLLADTWCQLGIYSGDKQAMKTGLDIFEKALMRFAQNVRYVDNIVSRFGAARDASGYMLPNAQLTLENMSIYNTYYSLVLLYNVYKYSYDHGLMPLTTQDVDKISISDGVMKVLSRAGISAQTFKRIQEYATPKMPASDADEAAASLTAEELAAYAQEFAKYAEVVVELQGKSAEEYAATSDDERQIDSTYMFQKEFFHYYGGTDEMLAGYENIGKVDEERSSRLLKEFIEAHPELLGGLQ